MPNLIRSGGEMFNWSDPAGRENPLLNHLIAGLAGPGRTVLVAGPHPAGLVCALVAGGAGVTWVLRSLGDAEHAAESLPAVTVRAGAFGKVDRADRYDLVVATDGIGRLNSAEGDQLSADELLDALAGAVRPGGALVLMHDNQLGAHHTVRLEAGARFRNDAAWSAGADGPASRAQLTARLTGAGLGPIASWAVFPEPADPAVLVGGDTLGDVTSPLRPWMQTVLAQAYTTAFRGRPVLSDPRELVTRALRAGAEETVAGGWLVVARAPGATDRSEPDRSEPDRSEPDRPQPVADDVLAVDVNGVYTVGVDGPRMLVPADGPAEIDGLRRVQVIRAAGGVRLEDRLLEFCAAGNVRGLRQEIAGYETWLGSAPIGGPEALADFSGLAVTGDGLTVMSARWAPIEPVPAQVALVRALWQFAVRLLTWGRPHPWPITASAADLAAILVGMAGRSLSDQDLRAAIDLQVVIDSAEFGLNEAGRQAHRLALRAVQPGTAPVDVTGYHQLVEALWRQRYQASHLLAMMEWTEGIIRSRDGQLSRMDWELQLLRRGWGGRSLMLAKRAYKMVRK